MKSVTNIILCQIATVGLLTACTPTPQQGQCTYMTDKDSTNIISISGNRFINGIYPHLTTYAHSRTNGAYKFGNECGIGAIVPWQGKLYMVNYADHRPQGSEHKLYIIDKDKNMEIFPGSVGGTPAARMIHAETNQLLIGHYVIDAQGNIRVIPITDMPGRITAIARHLEEPAQKAYYCDMEGMLYEVNLHTLEVKKLYQHPLPGWHGKGGYTAQGVLVLSNNGEAGSKDTTDWQVPAEGMNGLEHYGVLGEYDGKRFKVIERKQYTDITTRHGINAIANDNSPLWAIGWDKRSLRFKVRENGQWSTFLLPKASYNNDPYHGWFTEWPRIREVGNEMLMDMHGMFFRFPATFSLEETKGIRPIGSHLRYIPDFCEWNGQLVLATDETSIQGNNLSGQPQSNLWFGSKDNLKEWGPATGYGSIWLNDTIQAGSKSNPYLFAGFEHRMAHVINHTSEPTDITIEIDKEGNGNWQSYQTLELDGKAYKPLFFPQELQGEWIRLSTRKGGILTFSLHYASAYRNNSDKAEKLFKGLAEIGEQREVLAANLYANRSNYNLSCHTKILDSNKNAIAQGEYEFGKFTFEFTPGITDSLAANALIPQPIWSVDEASVILHTKQGKLRLPKGNAGFDSCTNTRSIREVESERELANIHGTFYEIPLYYANQDGLYRLMRPVASHNYYIYDYNSWNGLLVLSGLDRDAQTSNSVYINNDRTAGIWLGGIDDLWNLGKPTGEGGPWKNTHVKAGEKSDPYLMTGYDQKTLTLKANKDVNVTLWLDVAHYLNTDIKYKTFALKAGEELTYEFPQGFSAHWAMLSTDKDCEISAQFTYK